MHRARQQLLLQELNKYFEVDVVEYPTKYNFILNNVADIANYFRKVLDRNEYDLILLRGDRYEVLPIAMTAAYKRIKIAHIEGGLETGKNVIDSKVRHAISQLSDFHFVTDEQAEKRIIFLGASPKTVFNVGSLDVSYAKSIVPKQIILEDYILFLFHSIPGEDSQFVYDLVKDLGLKVIGIKANQDYVKSIMQEEYSPEDFISLMYFAKCIVGNSSSICKESSILGTPAILVGSRQDGRISGKNTLKVPFDRDEIIKGTKYQLGHGRYQPDLIYYQPNTEKRICDILQKVL